MLWLAGLLGVFAVGAFSFVDTGSSADDGENDGTLNDTGAENGDLATDAGTGAEDIGLDLAPQHVSIPGEGDIEQPMVSDQIIAGGTGNDDLAGGSGNDQINGYAGDDGLFGGAGNDDMHGNVGQDTLVGGADTDTLHGEDGQDALLGGPGNDSLFGHNDSDLIIGGGGNDELNGGTGNDVLRGGDGNDALLGGQDNDFLSGGAGADTLMGGWGNDVLSGLHDPSANSDGPESDVDYLNGGGGDDTIMAGAGDIVTSGDGFDDIFLGDLNTGGDAVQIVDYNAEQDNLVLVWDHANNPDPNVEVVADEQNPDLSTIFVNGVEVASVSGSGPVDASDIVLVDRSDPDMAALTGG